MKSSAYRANFHYIAHVHNEVLNTPVKDDTLSVQNAEHLSACLVSRKKHVLYC